MRVSNDAGMGVDQSFRVWSLAWVDVSFRPDDAAKQQGCDGKEVLGNSQHHPLFT